MSFFLIDDIQASKKYEVFASDSMTIVSRRLSIRLAHFTHIDINTRILLQAHEIDIQYSAKRGHKKHVLYQCSKMKRYHNLIEGKEEKNIKTRNEIN